MVRALPGREEGGDDRVAGRVEVRGDGRPVDGGEPRREAGSGLVRVPRRAVGGARTRAGLRAAGPARVQGDASRSRSARFRSTPQRYPPAAPSFRTTRWQGIATARGFDAHARATARAAPGEPMRSAISR